MKQGFPWLLVLACALCLLFLPACSGFEGSRGEPGAVVLDIGHSVSSQGAVMPGTINGKRWSECAFWYQYAWYTRQVIERAGYRCTICNRGNAPESEPLRSCARRARVIHLRHPDKRGERYPSRYFKDRVASGIVSADYAIWRRASCMVFLHHNSTSRRWRTGASGSVVLYNRHNGRSLARAIENRMERDILNHGMPNKGAGCSSTVRYKDAARGAGWLNACDDAGIPAAIIEVAYLNNRSHAAFLADDANARRYAEAVGQGIVDYLRSRDAEAPRHYRVDKEQADEGSFGYARESRSIEVPGAKRLIP